MKTTRINYDQLASGYDRRYQANPMDNVARCLANLADEMAARRVLEVGCGTGHWLNLLEDQAPNVFGLDLSLGMLRIGNSRGTDRTVQGDAVYLPFEADSLDMVFCVNALHHFGDPERFIQEAYRVLVPGGVLAVIGMDPHHRRDQWYAYQYFDGTFETDIARFPSYGSILDWMTWAGFHEVWWEIVEHKDDNLVGRSVFDHPFLKKESTSQLPLLSDESYAAGLAKIERALQEAEASGKTLLFRDELIIALTAARKPE